MAESPEENPAWAPQRGLPTDPEFYRRVLDHMPSALVVVDKAGQIIYANQAMYTLGGWTELPDESTTILDYVHPDDAADLGRAFLEIIDSPGARILGNGRRWAEIYLRIITADGTTLPIELIGNGGLLDPSVGGIIYEARPARTRNLLGRVLDGLSQGASMHHLLSLVAEMIASPPLDLEAAILQSASDGSHFVAASTSPLLSDVVSTRHNDMPWRSPGKQPTFMAVPSLPAHAAERLQQAGFQDMWHVGVESPLTAATLRIVAVSPSHHVPATGPITRLVQARELAAAVLLRSQSDVLLDYAAAHDRLTDLPNRAAFYQQAESFDALGERAALHLDLDGLKRVNNELGQGAGDAVLRVVADRLRSACASDDVIGRVGDSEFSILLTPRRDDTDMMKHSLDLAAALLQAAREPIFVAGRSLRLSVSIGAAVAGRAVGTDHLLTWADAAMHDAKRAGGDRICRYGVGYG